MTLVGSLRKIFSSLFGHFGLKILAVCVALVLWIVVSGEETVERGLRVPLEIQQFPAGMQLLSDPPSTVEVRLRGPSGVLGRLEGGDVVAVLDVRSARPGQRLFQLSPELVRAPFGVQVLQVAPATIAMAFEQSASRQLPVVGQVDGKPAPGYLVGRITAEPATVEVVGPQSAVARATEAISESVSVVDARASITESVTIGLLDPLLRLKNAGVAKVTVQILPASGQRSVRGRPVRLRNLGGHLSAHALPAAVDVRLRGSSEALGDVGADEVTAFVDLAGLGSGVYTLPVHVDPLSDAGVIGVEPSTVQVRVSNAPK